MARTFPAVLRTYNFDRSFLVTSRKLWRLFGVELHEALEKAEIRVERVLIRETERHKNWTTLSKLCEELVSLGATKDSLLIGLGGGLIGNVVGLAAALLYRGIRFVQVPTSITAQTDSALSNKQAINGRRGKNQFGAYLAPLFIWSDAAYSELEPVCQRRSGVVEGIKNVLISQPDTSAAELMLQAWESGDRFFDLLRLLIESKLPILGQDPSERSSCVRLEYGHTFGHAIEWLSKGRLHHGEAVSIGMCLAAELSHGEGYMSESFLEEHYRWLGTRLGMPTRLPPEISPDEVYEAMLFDNKRTGEGLRFLLLHSCGHFVNSGGAYRVPVDKTKVMEVLKRAKSARPPSDQSAAPAAITAPTHRTMYLFD
jgi:3-dehydroquinate synthetase